MLFLTESLSHPVLKSGKVLLTQRMKNENVPGTVNEVVNHDKQQVRPLLISHKSSNTKSEVPQIKAKEQQKQCLLR